VSGTISAPGRSTHALLGSSLWPGVHAYLVMTSQTTPVVLCDVRGRRERVGCAGGAGCHGAAVPAGLVAGDRGPQPGQTGSVGDSRRERKYGITAAQPGTVVRRAGVRPGCPGPGCPGPGCPGPGCPGPGCPARPPGPAARAGAGDRSDGPGNRPRPGGPRRYLARAHVQHPGGRGREQAPQQLQ
jgi:hypothetical protein